MAAKKIRYTLTKKKNGQYCTHNADSGNDIHCFKTRKAALQQLKALYASQGDPVGKDKAMLEHIECFEDDCGRSFLDFAALGTHLDQVHPESTADRDELARKFNMKQRKAAASKGQAMKDGSFPIANEQDLKNAISAFGRAKNKAAAKAHIIKRAKALGLTKLLPDGWTSDSSALVSCPCCSRTFHGDQAMLDHADYVHTFEDIRTMVSEKIREEYNRPSAPGSPSGSTWAWVQDLTDDTVYFQIETPGDCKTYQASYSISGTEVTVGDSTEVVRRTVYEPVNNQNGN